MLLALILFIPTLICIPLILIYIYYGLPEFMLSKKSKELNQYFQELLKDEENIRYTRKFSKNEWLYVGNKTKYILDRLAICRGYICNGTDIGTLSWKSYRLYREEYEKYKNVSFKEVCEKYFKEVINE